MGVKALRFMETDENCMCVVSHRPGKDGYVRISSGSRQGRRTAPLHRAILEARIGEIQSGFDVHHTCHNRLCCNPSHLEVVPMADHRRGHAADRFSERRSAAREYWIEHMCSGAELGRRFGVTKEAASAWIRKWRA